MLEDVLLSQNRHWREEKFPYGIERDIKKRIDKFMGTKHVLVITGVRRAGKSYLLFQMINSLLREIKPENILFVNFDDPSLTPLMSDKNALEAVYKTYIKLKNPRGKKYVFFDEIQNIPFWEKWIKLVYDLKEDVKFVITGSNATLLSAEMSTLLTGRNVKFEVFPFNFKEFLKAKGVEVFISSNLQEIYERNYSKKDAIQHYLMEFIKWGSFPEVAFIEEEVKETLLKTYYQDIIYKDIVPRFEIRQSRKLEDVGYHLITNISKPFSYNSIGKTVNIHENTAKEFLSYFEKAYLIFSLPRFHYSIKKQIKSPRKAYCIDTGLRNSLAFRFSQDVGRLAENLVFLELRQNNKELYYWKNKREVDFLVKEGLKVSEVLQVCWDIENEKVKSREVGGLLEALEEFKLKEGCVVTSDLYHKEKVQGFEIRYIPLWLWLLKNN